MRIQYTIPACVAQNTEAATLCALCDCLYVVSNAVHPRRSYHTKSSTWDGMDPLGHGCTGGLSWTQLLLVHQDSSHID